MFWMFVIFLPGFLAVGQRPVVYKYKTVTINNVSSKIKSTDFKDQMWAGPYGPYVMLVGTAILLTQVFGIISLAVGLNNGTAGSVQAIENQKTTI